MEKSHLKTFAALVVTFFCLSWSNAQNWHEMDARTVKVLADTSSVFACEVTILPGEKGKVHTHAAHFFYALTECHLLVNYTDGKSEKYDLSPGDCGYSNPERPHWTENVGASSARFLVVELKEHPFKQEAK